MSRLTQLDAESRDFLQRLTDIIFANPFSSTVAQVEQLLGAKVPVHGQAGHHYAALAPLAQAKLAQLKDSGITKVQDCAASDRQLILYVFLFELYDHYAAAFDTLIDAQLQKGDEPADVPFAQELLFRLKARGLNEAESARYVALFYQLRRAHFFISKGLIGASASMKALRHALWNNIFTADVRYYADHLWDRMEDFSTLLLGETGAGKGSAAAAIGRSGLIPFDAVAGRFKYSFTATFIATNLSQFPESLIESELFGHRKGAFTGAIDNHAGLFERCSPHGALFLDEIGDVSIPVQIKLLNVLQERRFCPVGGHKVLRFQGRVIAATNKTLDKLRQTGDFRDDFYYRLSSDVIHVPPLRTRLQEASEELEQLVGLLVERLTDGPDSGLVEKVMAALATGVPRGYAWPGNVRELEQAVRRIILNGDCKLAPAARPDAAWLDAAETGQMSAQDLLAAYCRMLYARHQSYEDVAAITQLNWRTVKKYIGSNDESPAAS